VLRIYRPIDIP
jgi:hypothetical protein